jgi:hypothetical protein
VPDDLLLLAAHARGDGEAACAADGGRACLELRAKGGLTIEHAFDLVGRAFAMAAAGPGMINEPDADGRPLRRWIRRSERRSGELR